MLQRGFAYSDRVTVTEMTGAEILAYGISMKVVSRESQKLGDIVRMSDESAVLATYYRNNIVHLFAMPSLIACVFSGNARVRTEDIQRLAWRIYPYIAAELFLVLGRKRSCKGSSTAYSHASSNTAWWSAMPTVPNGSGRRPTSIKAMQLSLLAQATIQTIERYYLAIAQLVKAGSGEITQAALEERCQLTAQRMTLLYGLNSPEFFDRTMFKATSLTYCAAAMSSATRRTGKLEFDEVLMRVASDAQFVFSEQLRHSILQVTHS